MMSDVNQATMMWRLAAHRCADVYRMVLERSEAAKSSVTALEAAAAAREKSDEAWRSDGPPAERAWRAAAVAWRAAAEAAEEAAAEAAAEAEWAARAWEEAACAAWRYEAAAAAAAEAEAEAVAKGGAA